MRMTYPLRVSHVVGHRFKPAVVAVRLRERRELLGD